MSGGKETNKDSLSNGEWSGKSSNLKSPMLATSAPFRYRCWVWQNTPSSVRSNSAMIGFSFSLSPSDTFASFIEWAMSFYTFLPRMFISLFLESIEDSSHLLLPTWPCPRWLFRFAVDLKKLPFYTEETTMIKKAVSTRRYKQPTLKFRYQSLTLKYIIGIFS